ncbi:MAG: VrrA/YqfQ family protein [bacterium]|nr:VrrA/YqfQ family protein [bacterium]
MYNNPFIYQSLYRPSLISRLFGGASAARGIAGGINWGNILSNTQKGLGIINQAIPLVYQIKPIISNAKTMFKIADAIKDGGSSDNNTKNTTSSNIEIDSSNSNYNTTTNKPIFYI